MAAPTAAGNRMGALVVSAGSVVIAALQLLDTPQLEGLTEPLPDWYSWFTAALHGMLLVFLLLFLAQLGRMTADRPALRLPILAALLVGIVAAAYVLARDFNLV